LICERVSFESAFNGNILIPVENKLYKLFDEFDSVKVRSLFEGDVGGGLIVLKNGIESQIFDSNHSGSGSVSTIYRVCVFSLFCDCVVEEGRGDGGEEEEGAFGDIGIDGVAGSL
jgi:hypothetical protein